MSSILLLKTAVFTKVEYSILQRVQKEYRVFVLALKLIRSGGRVRGEERPPFCGVLVAVEQYPGTHRAFWVRACYRNGDSIVTAQRLYRTEYRTGNAPSDDSIR